MALEDAIEDKTRRLQTPIQPQHDASHRQTRHEIPLDAVVEDKRGHGKHQHRT